MFRFQALLRKIGVILSLAAILPVTAHAAEVSKENEPLTINWYHGADVLQPVIDAYIAETGRDVLVTDSYDTFDTDVVLVGGYKGLTEGKKFKHFQPLNSIVAENAVPSQWRDRDGYWVGVLLRARAPIYNKTLIASDAAPRTWFDLAKPQWKGKVALRGSDNVYNRSLLAWMIHHYGEKKAKAWARGVLANADPSATFSGDTANAEKVSKGEASVSFINTYYLGYMQGPLLSRYDEDLTQNISVSWMDNDKPGQQVNVTGAAILADTNKPEEARALIEWFLTEKGQRLLSEHVFKYPVRQDVPPSAYLQSLGEFRYDMTDLNDLEYYYDKVDQIYREIGWPQNW